MNFTLKEINVNKNTILLKSFIFTFLIIIAFLGGIITAFYNIQTKDYLKNVMLNEVNTLQLEKEIVLREFDSTFSDLLFLSRQNELIDFINTENSIYKNAVDFEYYQLSKLKKKYDQIRFIDQDGMEKSRVNYNSGNPGIVELKDLQSKKDRYYFNDSFNLKKGDIYASPFDLNIEKGIVERPFKPMIRFGTPVFDDLGNKKGVVILNYLGESLIKTILDIAKLSSDNIMLVNSDGYWLIATKKENEWGFMFDYKHNIKFSNDFPKEWEKIYNNNSSQFITDNGLFTSTTIYPLSSKIITSTGSWRAYDKSEKVFSAKNYYWKLISYVPTSTLNLMSRPLLFNLLWMGLILFLISSIPSYLIAAAVMKRRLHKLELLYMANYDKLTTLPNRKLFIDRLEQGIKIAERSKIPIGLLFIDLDGFKNVNDTLGHQAGDILLQMVSDRLIEAVRKSDTVARLGGDEFTVLINDCKTIEDAINVADKILHLLNMPFIIDGIKKQIGGSIGISMYSENSKTADILLKHADDAMYSAKNQGKNNYVVFKG